MAIVDFTRSDAFYTIRSPGAADFTNLGTSNGGANLTWNTTNGSRAVGVANGLVTNSNGVPTSGTFSSIRFDLGTPGLYNNIIITGLALDVTDLDYSTGQAATNTLWNNVMSGATEIRLSETFATVIAGDGLTPSASVAGNDVFRGLGADNTILTGDFDIVRNTTLTGGNDRFNVTADVVDGDVNQLENATLFGGNDTVVYIDDWTKDPEISVSGDAYFVTDSTVHGGDDRIDLSAVSSTTRDNLIYGDSFSLGGTSMLFGGDDTIIGTAAADRIYGDADIVGAGSSVVGGNDVIYGGAGDDLIYGDTATEGPNITGGNDTIFGGFGNDTIFGGGGNDRIYGESGDDSINGGSGNNYIDGGGRNDTIITGSGNDTVLGNTGNDVIFTFLGDDLIYGGPGNDRLDGGTGSDTIYGGDGRDRVVGRFNDDFLYGGAGDDNIYGGHGNDFMVGGSGNDRMIGQIGNDTIFGGAGNDTISAGDGQDFINGGAGDDNIQGGAGADFFVFTGNFGTDRIIDFETTGAHDVLVLRDVNGIDNYQDLINNHMRQIDNIVQISDFAGNRVLVFDVTVSEMMNEDLYQF